MSYDDDDDDVVVVGGHRSTDGSSKGVDESELLNHQRLGSEVTVTLKDTLTGTTV